MRTLIILIQREWTMVRWFLKYSLRVHYQGRTINRYSLQAFCQNEVCACVRQAWHCGTKHLLRGSLSISGFLRCTLMHPSLREISLRRKPLFHPLGISMVDPPSNMVHGGCHVSYYMILRKLLERWQFFNEVYLQLLW